MDETLTGATPEVAAPEATPAAEPASIEQPTAAQPEPEGVKAEPAAPQPEAKPAKPVQSAEDNAAAAAARRRAELEAKNKYDGVDDLLAAIKGFGYQGKTAKEIAQEIKAQKEGTSVEEIQRREREAEEIRKKALEEAPELQEARRIIAEKHLNDHLQKIKEIYPDVKAKTPLELGDKFVALMATGKVDPVTAYEAQLAHNKRNAPKEAPPSIGPASSVSVGTVEKEYYTPEEVDRLTSADYDKNPKLMQTVRNSMFKWKK